jgi:hypothetical protein
MPTASALAGTVLNPPPSGEVVHATAQSSAVNVEYDGILPETLRQFSSQRIASFKSWLRTVPFNYNEIRHSTLGHYMENEGDVRMYIEPAIILACWPIVLAMVGKDSRQFDMAIRSEKTLVQPQSRTRPDLSIFKLQRSRLAFTDSLNPELELLLTSVVEYKGPGVLRDIVSFGELAVGGVDNDDWDTATAQIRKYAELNNVNGVVVVDDKWLVYFHFTDPKDTGADCLYLVSSVGTPPPGFHPAMTARETFLLSAFNGLIAKNTSIRYVIRISSNITIHRVWL